MSKVYYTGKKMFDGKKVPCPIPSVRSWAVWLPGWPMASAWPPCIPSISAGSAPRQWKNARM